MVRDLPEFLAALAHVSGMLVELHQDAERLMQPQSVTMGLHWLRDDAASLLSSMKGNCQ